MEPFIAEENTQNPPLLYLPKWTKRFPNLTAGFTTRLGGVGGGRFASLNCALHVGDNAADVLANRAIVARAIGMEADSWTCAEQVHGCKVACVGRADKGKGRLSRASAVGEFDALITVEKGVLLTAFFADCVPLYFLDPEHEAIAIAHAGWRGTAQNIVHKTVQALAAQFGSDPAKLSAAIGPAIGPCCYEVGDDVVSAIAAQLGENREKIAKVEQLPPSADGKTAKTLLDLKEANRQFMIKAGILPANIEISRRCTSCDSRLFFSHRRDGGPTGRMAAWIGWKDGG
ncbi:MAG TPA: peptidoglycan editing factor PgeF [Bacilli bacterium]